MTSCSTASITDSSASDKVSATFCSTDGCRGWIRDNKRRAVMTICVSEVGLRTSFISEVVSATMTVDGIADVAIIFSSSATEASSTNLKGSELIKVTKKKLYLGLKPFTNGQSILSLPDHKAAEAKSLPIFLQTILLSRHIPNRNITHGIRRIDFNILLLNLSSSFWESHTATSELISWSPRTIWAQADIAPTITFKADGENWYFWDKAARRM